MEEQLRNGNRFEGFTGFGKDGNESRLAFIMEFNDLLCDYLAVCDDDIQKAAMAEFVANEISILLHSAEDDLEAEIEVLDCFESAYEEFESMVSEQYEMLVETTEAECMEEILEEAKDMLADFEEDDVLNREYCILMVAKNMNNPCSCGCDCGCEEDEDTEE